LKKEKQNRPASSAHCFLISQVKKNIYEKKPLLTNNPERNQQKEVSVYFKKQKKNVIFWISQLFVRVTCFFALSMISNGAKWRSFG
jgi:hypothetical protein